MGFVVEDLASELLYLHEILQQPLLHKNIKLSNVMVDSDFRAKLGDFKFGNRKEPQMITKSYMAPEYINTGQLSKKSDVFSFEIVALEISCGKKPINPKFGGSQVNMVEWVWELYVKGRVIEAADPKLRGDFDEKQMECLLIVGLWCAHPNYNSRPSIQQVIQTLNFEVAVPILPSKMRTNSSPLTISISGSCSSIGSEGRQVDDSGPIISPIAH
ncbi:hypothetical protein PRUPE_1G157800 [Prunus persica]|uniref:Protein kinase domain-containing protein n=1 Tax=Prunus persica TaxID=3760 RepID=A0A251R114_PRUPE|nr:hypothetical protein PRUPE_1G157800 [Prunus persica]